MSGPQTDAIERTSVTRSSSESRRGSLFRHPMAPVAEPPSASDGGDARTVHTATVQRFETLTPFLKRANSGETSDQRPPAPTPLKGSLSTIVSKILP